MPVLVDYRCPDCQRIREVRTPSPPPSSQICPQCGGEAARVWSPFGIGHSVLPPDRSPPAPRRSAPLCATNPDVPGLCHMTPTAGRAWLARARKDGRALDRELEHQERAARTSPPATTDVVSHSHSHDHQADHHSHDHQAHDHHPLDHHAKDGSRALGQHEG